MEPFRDRNERANESSTTEGFKLECGMQGAECRMKKPRTLEPKNPRTLNGKCSEAKRDEGGDGTQKRLD